METIVKMYNVVAHVILDLGLIPILACRGKHNLVAVSFILQFRTALQLSLGFAFLTVHVMELVL